MSNDLLVRYAEFDDTVVAWSSTGSGPALVVPGWWCSHLAHDWEDRHFREYIEHLGASRTVVRYDRPGTGLSGGSGAPPATLDEEYSALAGLVDALDLERFDLHAGSSGCPTAVVYTARHASRVGKLVLSGGFARGADIAPPAVRDTLIDAARTHWGLGSRVLADVFIPDASAHDRAEFAELQRRRATPEQAAASLRALYGFDCTRELAAVTASTLVLHRRDDRAIRYELGKHLAAGIPGARLVSLDGADHFPWRGDRAAMLREIDAFLASDLPSWSVAPPVEPAELSPREREVLSLVAAGQTDREIAAALVLSPHTVHRHVANIRTKLGVGSRAAAVAWAAAHGVV